MATEKEIEDAAYRGSLRALQRELTYPRTKLGGAGGKVSIQDQILWMAADNATVHKKLDALVAAATTQLEQPTVDPQQVYAEIGRQVVAAFKEEA